VTPRQINCLLLEDSSVDAELIAHHLMKLEGEVAVTLVDIRPEFERRLAAGSFDVILSDYSLPSFTGLEALDLARRSAPDVPFIFISGVLGEERATEALRAGATDYVTKRDLPRIPMVVERALREARERHAAREAAAALAASEAHYRSAVELNPQIVWTALPSGEVDHMSERWSLWTGHDGSGPRWVDGLHEEDREMALAAWRQAIATGEPYDVEYRLRMRSGEARWVRSRAYPRLDASGEILKWYGTTEDTNERKLAEDELVRLNETLEMRILERTAELVRAQEALRQSQKLEAMGQLTGGVAHDFNNLLTPIIGSLDILQRRGAGDERTRPLIEGALQAAERAKTLVQRLLAFARRQPLQPTSVDLAVLIEGMADLIASTCGPRIQVVTRAPHDLPAACADANQIEMAVLNLAVNARDAMPEGGRLIISASLDDIGDDHVSRLPPARYLRLTVQDSGIGMDAETLARAIEPFFSTKGIGKGTGLGLSMVHGLTAQLGGSLALESAQGAGTRADLWLPLAETAAVPAGKVVPEERGLGKGTVLLVDDEQLVRVSTAEMLTDLGYMVVPANSAEAALALLGGGIQPNLLVTDNLMPGMTGVELALSAPIRAMEMPVVLMSGYTEDQRTTAGFVRLNKPFRRAELANALAKAVQKTPVNETLGGK